MPQPRRTQLYWVWPELLQFALAHLFVLSYRAVVAASMGCMATAMGSIAVCAMTGVTPIGSLCTERFPTTPVVLITTLTSEKSSSSRFLPEALFSMELASNPGSELAVEEVVLTTC